MIIEHRNNVYLTDANYFFWLISNLFYDPLLKDYIQQVPALHHHSLSLTGLPIAPDNQPYFCGPQVSIPCMPQLTLPGTQPPEDIVSVSVALSGLQHLSSWQVYFGLGPQSTHSIKPLQCLYNSDIDRAADMLAYFDWALYGFNIGVCYFPGQS
jgi:hypothetical protein